MWFDANTAFGGKFKLVKEKAWAVVGICESQTQLPLYNLVKKEQKYANELIDKVKVKSQSL